MIYLVRHGESVSNAGSVTKDIQSICLSEKGKQQAQAFADSITAKPDLIIVSPYIRTAQTAQPLINKFPNVPVETWDVQEFRFLSHAAYYNTTQDDRYEIAQVYFDKNDPDYKYEDGESLNELMSRVDIALKKLSEFDKDKFIVVFTHCRFIEAVRVKTQNIKCSVQEFLQREEIENTGVLKL